MSNPLGGIWKPVVTYYYDDDVGNYQYNQGHPMKPFRIRMTDEMIKAYGLDKHMKHIDIDSDFIEKVDLSVFHSDDYVDILKTLNIDNKDLYAD